MDAEALRAVVAGALGDERVEIAALQRLTGGASRETWSLEARHPDGASERLILRREPPGGKAIGFAKEAAAIGAAHDGGVPGPRILAHSEDPATLGAPFLLMDFIDGETLAPRILRDERFAGVRPRLAGQCGEILARIHAIPPAAVPGLEGHDPLHGLREHLDTFAEPSPAFEVALRWLEAHRPPPVPPRLLHGDFRNGNLIVGEHGVAAVLDWELVHAGDPMEDLGYLCARVWRFGGPGPVGGFGAYADLFDGYARGGGGPVDPERVAWWELRATLWWGITCMQMASWHLDGTRRSVELAAIGRRAHEQEYDLMLMLAERLGVAA